MLISDYVKSKICELRQHLFGVFCPFSLLEEIVGEYSQGNIGDAKLLIWGDYYLRYFCSEVPEKFILGEIYNAYESRRKEVSI